MAENLVEIYDSQNRDWEYAYYFPDNNQDIAKQNLQPLMNDAVPAAKRILQRDNSIKEDIPETEKVILTIAKNSLEQEKNFYKVIFNEEAQGFNNAVDEGFESMDPAYMLNTTYKGQSLYKALTYKILQFDDTSDESGKFELVQILSSLRTNNIFQAAGASAIELDPIETAAENIQQLLIAYTGQMAELKLELTKGKTREEAQAILEQTVSENTLFNGIIEIENEEIEIPKTARGDIQKLSKAFIGDLFRHLQMISGDKKFQEIYMRTAKRLQDDFAEQLLVQCGHLIEAEGLTRDQVKQILLTIVTSGQPIRQAAYYKNQSGGVVIRAGLSKDFSEFLKKKLEDSGLFSKIKNSEIQTNSEIDSLIPISEESKKTVQIILGKLESSKNKNYHDIIRQLILNWTGKDQNGLILNNGSDNLMEFQERAWKYYQTIALAVDNEVQKDAEIKTETIYKQSGLHEEIKSMAKAMSSIQTLALSKQRLSDLGDSIKNILNKLLPIDEGKLSKAIDSAEDDALKDIITLINAISKNGKIKFSEEQIFSVEQIKKSLQQPELFIQNFLPGILATAQAKMIGYVSTIQGSIGEIIYTVILRQTLGENNSIYQLGRARNKLSQQAHADIAIETALGKFGIQSKVYKENSVDLYSDSKVNFAVDEAIRYLGSSDELTAFRFFIINNSVLKELNNLAVDNSYFLEVLYQRLDYFIRMSDGLSNLEDIKNNFYLVNFNLIPTSAVLLLILQTIKQEGNKKQLITYTPDTEGLPLKKEDVQSSSQDFKNDNLMSPNVLKYIKNKAKFKGLTVNLNKLGAIFNK